MAYIWDEIFEEFRLDTDMESSGTRFHYLQNMRYIHLGVMLFVAILLGYITHCLDWQFIRLLIILFVPVFIISILVSIGYKKMEDKFSPLYFANILIDMDIFLIGILSYLFGGLAGPMIYFFVYIVLLSTYLLPPKSSIIHGILALLWIGLFIVLIHFPYYMELDTYSIFWITLNYRIVLFSHGIVISVVLALSSYVGGYIYIKMKEQEKLLEEILALAYHHSITDSLTGLYDQQFFRKRLQESLYIAKAEGKKISVIMLDVDFFKNYNDTNGHLKGSETLQKVAMIINSSVRKRKGDTVARYGGDEFIVMLIDANRDVLEMVCRRIVEKVKSERFEGEEKSQPGGKLTISAGGAVFPDDCKGDYADASEIIDIADMRLYEAKRRGKATYIVK